MKQITINVNDIDTCWEYEVNVNKVNAKEITKAIINFETTIFIKQMELLNKKGFFKAEGITKKEHLKNLFFNLSYSAEGHELIKLSAVEILKGISTKIK